MKAKQYPFDGESKLKGLNILCNFDTVEHGEIKEKFIVLTPKDLTIQALKKLDYLENLSKKVVGS